jgi:hypothetical protein
MAATGTARTAKITRIVRRIGRLPFFRIVGSKARGRPTFQNAWDRVQSAHSNQRKEIDNSFGMAKPGSEKAPVKAGKEKRMKEPKRHFTEISRVLLQDVFKHLQEAGI